MRKEDEEETPEVQHQRHAQLGEPLQPTPPPPDARGRTTVRKPKNGTKAESADWEEDHEDQEAQGNRTGKEESPESARGRTGRGILPGLSSSMWLKVSMSG